MKDLKAEIQDDGTEKLRQQGKQESGKKQWVLFFSKRLIFLFYKDKKEALG
jgi:hypothetical protein